MEKVIVGVSGGPDSMYLLYKLYNKKTVTPIVAHVNYNFRPESVKETELVRKFCDKNNIELYVLEVNDKVKRKYKHFSNKQQMAREIRYDFYIEVANKVNARYLYLGHHKDDFIETAIMQESRSTELPFYGIEEKSQYQNLLVRRPLLKMFKDDILKECKKKNIPYLHDSSNFTEEYERNRIRLNLAKKSKKDKKKIYKHFKMINKSREGLKKEILYRWIEFANTNFDKKYFLSLNEVLQFQLMLKMLIASPYYIKINKNKVNGAIEYIKTLKGSGYRLMDNIFLVVKDSKIKIYTK